VGPKGSAPLSVITAVIDAVERSSVADRIAPVLERVASPLRRMPNGRSLLSGTVLGHPLHPLLVTAPIGAWTCASVFDLTGRERRAARSLVGAGVVMAVPTALAGASDWLDTDGVERRVGATHATLNAAATTVYAASWLVRPRRPALGVALGLAGAVLASASGWLGGHLTYALGVGVDTNAFDAGPTSWTDLGVAVPTGTARLGVAGGTRLATTRVGGDPAVVGERCSHRGGPLSEGAVIDGCFSCPWHGSRFDARTGAVRRGPASVPQPVYETREEGGTIQVRRQEQRALRTNAV